MSRGAEARILGKWGEQLVAEDLRSRGWAIAACNFRCRMGEIDIIAENGVFLIFVEVKLRKNNWFASACEAVTPVKQRRLYAAAQFYLISHSTELQPRFDVAEVYAPQGIHTKRPSISYIENAF